MSVLSVFKEAWRERHTMGDKNRTRELSAFLPAALEIQESPPNPLVRWLSWSLLTLVSMAIVWAVLGQVNIVASAEGKIIPSSRVKQIQPLEKGVVKSILVNEGDYVDQGQSLIELDTTLTNADKNRIQSELHSLALNLSLNRALLIQIGELNQTSISPDGKTVVQQQSKLQLILPESVEAVDKNLYEKLLWQQWQQFLSEYNALNSALIKTKAERSMSQENAIKLEKILPIVTKRTLTQADLFKKKYVSETDYLISEQERIQIKQDLAAEKQRQKQLSAAEAEVAAKISMHVAKASSQLLIQIADQQRQQSALEEELVKAVNLNSRQVLYAPVAGRVQDLIINTVGGIVTEAQQLMLIVPDEQQLEVEVFLNNKDIGFVKESMPAEVKIHTYPFTKYGIVDAKVINVSDDATVDEQRGLVYRMQLKMARNTLWVEDESVRLQPGMAVTAEVKTGTRRVIEFFMAPLLRAKNESIRER